jgi:hypothetical protein
MFVPPGNLLQKSIVLKLQGSPHHWQFPRINIGPRYACGFPNSIRYHYITKLFRNQAEVIRNHENENIRYIGQDEAKHKKIKRLELGCGHLYDCSNV